jgi:hypothetical protein
VAVSKDGPQYRFVVPGASPFAGAPAVPYPNIGCKAEDRFFDQAVLAARPPEIRCPCRQGIRLPSVLLDVFSNLLLWNEENHLHVIMQHGLLVAIVPLESYARPILFRDSALIVLVFAPANASADFEYSGLIAGHLFRVATPIEDDDSIDIGPGPVDNELKSRPGAVILSCG